MKRDFTSRAPPSSRNIVSCIALEYIQYGHFTVYNLDTLFLSLSLSLSLSPSPPHPARCSSVRAPPHSAFFLIDPGTAPLPLEFPVFLFLTVSFTSSSMISPSSCREAATVAFSSISLSDLAGEPTTSGSPEWRRAGGLERRRAWREAREKRREEKRRTEERAPNRKKVATARTLEVTVLWKGVRVGLFPLVE